MKKILTILLLLPILSMAQPSIGKYTPYNVGVNYLRAYFRALNIPVGCGSPVLKTDQWNGSGAVYLDSCADITYIYSLGVWRNFSTTTNTSLGSGVPAFINGSQFKSFRDSLYWVIDTSSSGVIRGRIDTAALFTVLRGTMTASKGIYKVGNDFQLGTPYGSATPMSFTGHREISTDSDLVFSNRGSAYFASNPSEVRIRPINGAGIRFISNQNGGIEVFRRFGATADSYAGFYHFKETSPGVYQEEVASAIHWTPSDKHFDIADMYDSIIYSAIQGAGVTRDVFNADGRVWLAASGIRRVGIGGFTLPDQTLSIFGSLSATDSVITPGLIRVSDTTGFDVDMIDRSTGNHKKIYSGLIGGGGGISDGDKGDITVSASGATWTIDNLAVTNAKINDVAVGKITGITGTPDGTKFLRDDYSWQVGGSGMSNPMTTTGDMISSTGSTPVRLALGSSGAFIRSTGTVPGWSTLILPNAATVNRIPYATATNTWGESANFTWNGASHVIQPSSDNQNTIQLNAADGTTRLLFGTHPSFPTYAGMWPNVTPSGTNYAMISNGPQILFNSTSYISFRINNTIPSSIAIISSGLVGIGEESPTARLHLPAGTASASTAPLKFTSGPVETTVRAGLKEYNNAFYESNNALNRYGMGGVIADFIADGNNSGTAETDLYTYTTKASTLGATGEKLISQFSGTFNDVTATAQLQVYFGGTSIGNTGTLTISAIGGWNVNIIIIRTGSTTARSVVAINTPGASTAVYTSETDITGLTFTNTNIIKITGTAGGGTGGSSDITGKLGNIFWYPAANN